MAYVLTLQPTFTQGFILGQLSILVLLVLVLKYLFLDSSTETAASPPLAPLSSSIRSGIKRENYGEKPISDQDESLDTPPAPMSNDKESTEWFNLILHEIFNTYRGELRDNVKGLRGDEIVRERVERWINKHKGSEIIDLVSVKAVSLGDSAPRLFNAQVIPKEEDDPNRSGPRIRVNARYTDTIALQVTTSLIFNQPVPLFARLPVSLTLTLNMLRATITVIPPARDDPEPILTLRLEPDLELSLDTESRLGAKAQLSNVPKIHELIENRLRRALINRGMWRIHLPIQKDPS